DAGRQRVVFAGQPAGERQPPAGRWELFVFLGKIDTLPRHRADGERAWLHDIFWLTVIAAVKDLRLRDLAGDLGQRLDVISGRAFRENLVDLRVELFELGRRLGVIEVQRAGVHVDTR